MLSPYVDVLRRPGAFRMSSTGFLARFPMAMIGIGEVLLVSAQTGSYALAGALSATGALANAVFGPLLGRATDRYGQSRVTSILVAVHVVTLTAFIVLAFESVLDEVIYVLGPPIATVLAVSVVDFGALAAVAVLLVVGSVLFLRARDTEPPAGGTSRRGEGSALRFPGVISVTLAFVFLGGLFGAFEVVTVAFADEAGVRGWTGLLLGLYALASGTSGVVLGAVHMRMPMHRQLLVFSGLMALATVPFPFLTSPWWIGAQCLLAGLAVSPVLINGFALIERLVPNARMTEGLVWTNTGIGVGIAIAAALAGSVIDARGASTAYWICVVSAVLTFLVVLVSTPTLSRAWVTAHASPDDDVVVGA